MTPNNIINVVRIKYPNSVLSEIESEEILPPIELGNKYQAIEIEDPRRMMIEFGNLPHSGEVWILRQERQDPINKEGFYLSYVKIIEVIKKYTYEEWDNYEM